MKGINEQYSILLQVNDTMASNQPYFGNGLKAHLMAFRIMRASWNDAIEGEGDSLRQYYNVTNVNATKCGLDIYVKKYRGSMEMNVFKE
jgi:hypothetical protein